MVTRMSAKHSYMGSIPICSSMEESIQASILSVYIKALKHSSADLGNFYSSSGIVSLKLASEKLNEAMELVQTAHAEIQKAEKENSLLTELRTRFS